MNGKPATRRTVAPSKPIPRGRLRATPPPGKPKPSVVDPVIENKLRELVKLFWNLKKRDEQLEEGRQVRLRVSVATVYREAYEIGGDADRYHLYKATAYKLGLPWPKKKQNLYRILLLEVCDTKRTASWVYCATKPLEEARTPPETFRQLIVAHGIKKAAIEAGLAQPKGKRLKDNEGSPEAAPGKPQAVASKSVILRDDRVFDDGQLDVSNEAEDLDEILDRNQETEAGSAKLPKPVLGKPTTRNPQAEQASSVPPLSRSSAGTRSPDKVNFRLVGRERVVVGDEIIIKVASVEDDENGQTGCGTYEMNF